MNRRELFRGAAAIGVGTLATATFPELIGCGGTVSRPKFNMDLLHQIEGGLGALVKPFATNQDTLSDRTAFTTHLNMLGAELQRVNADASFQYLAQKAMAKNLVFDAHDTMEEIAKKILPYMKDFPVAKLEAQLAKIKNFDPSVSPLERQQATVQQLSDIMNKGLTAYVAQVAGIFTAQTGVGTAPQFTDPISEPDPGPAPPSVPCWYINFTMEALGTIATTLAVMCFVPEPFLVVICPAAAVFGIIAGILATIAWIFC